MFEKMKKYPLIPIFFIFLFGYMLLDFYFCAKPFDELENRNLKQKPAFSWASLATNEYTVKYEEYINDQFVLRHQWISLKSRFEYLLGKIENNGVTYGDDGYMFVKLFSLNEELFDKNLDAVTTFVNRHSDVPVSVMLVPSASNVLSEKLPAGAPMIDENSYMDRFYNTLAETPAKGIDVRSSFEKMSNQYIYYRTDHHWTSQGAYTAYREFLLDKTNLTPFELSNHTAVNVPDFLGTNYRKCLSFNVKPDTLTYYELPYTVSIEGKGDNLPMYDTAKFDTYDKYAAFMRGNSNRTVLTGSGNGKILIIRDSYADSFAPYLSENYATIDLVDMRYFRTGIDKLIAENNYDEILILYNFQTFASDENLIWLNINN